MFEWFFRRRRVDKICLELFKADGMRLMDTSFVSIRSAIHPPSAFRLGIFYDSTLFGNDSFVYCDIDKDGYIIPTWYVKTAYMRTLPSSFPAGLHDLGDRLLVATKDRHGIHNSYYKMSGSTHYEISKVIGEMIVLHKLSK